MIIGDRHDMPSVLFTKKNLQDDTVMFAVNMPKTKNITLTQLSAQQEINACVFQNLIFATKLIILHSKTVKAPKKYIDG